jgi:hypothetical protein
MRLSFGKKIEEEYCFGFRDTGNFRGFVGGLEVQEVKKTSMNKK